jgi:uncharacterized protein involved in exopolysaccharide biosynthesis
MEGGEGLISSMRSLFIAVPQEMRGAMLAALRVAPFAAALGVALALTLPKHYLSTASFIAETQSSRSLPASLGALADQVGFAAAAGGGASPAFLADLLESRAILLPILYMQTTTTADTVPRPVIERLRLGSPKTRDREERGIRKLRGSLRITPDVKTNVVSLGVDARDPQLAYQIAQALLVNLDSFNVSVRRSRAGNERAFLEDRVSDAKNELQAVEGDLERFLNSNRSDTRSSPSLAFRETRLRRNVDLAQTRFVELQRQLDQARVQEVRDTPAITVLDKPNVPARPDRPRRKLVVLVVLAVGMLAAYALSRLSSIIKSNHQPSVSAG